MPRSRLVTAVALVLACCLAGMVPAAQAVDEPAYTWEGVWNSDFGRLTLDASGSGSYEGFSPGTVTGELKPGNVLEGTWSQPGNNPPKKGTLTFTMSFGGRSFSGEWHYDSGGCGSACGWNGTCLEGPCLQNGASSPSPAASPSAACPLADLVVTVSRVSGEAAYREGAGEWQPLKQGDRLPANSEVFTGVDSGLTLVFLDGGSFEVGELTQILMETLTTAENRKILDLQLKLGAIKATVPKEKVLDCNFEIQTPTATAGVRGTVFSVSFDDKTGVTVVSVEESSVSVDPVAPGLATTMVDAGEEVAVSRTAMSERVAPGTAARQLAGGSSAKVDKDGDSGGVSPFLVALALLLVAGLGAGVAYVVRRDRGAAPPAI
ncbi:MAG: FecR domain-containing protein [Frankiaceae bacterium]|nr:FecR domain-containing protein [Frankiaceae bacterium]